ncbi:DUF4283 domain-containing protein/zf-CCHC_4 domain-containing protein [Cephalotus follicularis]|uniref:DUF4283 domain-containing protein/zf-CCHC_4 domain-containing protein n=1 Tax=Cephalotus follicularis TaxID=3775 RepID=A0A1Q3DIH4_CEPFO|nr:DUF4283 domain-containing protein/zf-CCHC_4 domain-containing protein [Cephalotus follicularis]
MRTAGTKDKANADQALALPGPNSGVPISGDVPGGEPLRERGESSKEAPIPGGEVRKAWSHLFHPTRRESQKLTYIAPTTVDGESMAVMPEEVIEEGAKEWENALVGYFVGKKIPFRSLHAVLNKKWSEAGKFTIHTAENGIFVFKCESLEVRNWILDNGPWDVWGVHLALRLWERDMPPICSGFTKIPVWVKLLNIPMEYWTPRGLSHLASVLGTPLHMDPATEAKQMISFARLCVEMCADRTFPEVIKVKRSSGAVVEVRVEYNWKPPVCERCKVFDHSTRACPVRPVPPVAVPKVSEAKGTPNAEGWVEVKGKGKEKMIVVSETQVPALKPALKNSGPSIPPRNLEAPKTPDKGKIGAEDSPGTASPGGNPLALRIKNIEGQLQMEPISKGVPQQKRAVENKQSGNSSSNSRKKKRKSLPTGQSRNPRQS